jgi:hypothetical protein
MIYNTIVRNPHSIMPPFASPRMCDADVTSAKRLASVINSSIVRDAIVLVNLDSFFDSTTAMTKSPKYL